MKYRLYIRNIVWLPKDYTKNIDSTNGAPETVSNFKKLYEWAAFSEIQCKNTKNTMFRG